MTLEQRIEKLERTVAELQQKPGYHDPVELQMAVKELAKGNRKPFNEYVKKGGKI